MAEPLDAPDLPCPECRMRGFGGRSRIGNRRSRCNTCNNFAQNVMRVTRRELVKLHGEEYMAIRLRAELELYPKVITDFTEAHPLSLGEA
jgi:hypothetical protein